jgi:hypothetical protein
MDKGHKGYVTREDVQALTLETVQKFPYIKWFFDLVSEVQLTGSAAPKKTNESFSPEPNGLPTVTDAVAITIQKVYDALDNDKNGEVTSYELLAMFVKLKFEAVPDKDAKLYHLYLEIDIDGDKCISFHELVETFSKPNKTEFHNSVLNKIVEHLAELSANLDNETGTSDQITEDETVGSYGGKCVCPNGTQYMTGFYKTADGADSCLAMACEGGAESNCYRFPGYWSGRKVTCGDSETSDPVRMDQ